MLACLRICKEARVSKARSVTVGVVRQWGWIVRGQWSRRSEGLGRFWTWVMWSGLFYKDHNLLCLEDCKGPRVAGERNVMKLLWEPRGRNDDGLHQSGSAEKWLDSGYILKIERAPRRYQWISSGCQPVAHGPPERLATTGLEHSPLNFSQT